MGGLPLYCADARSDIAVVHKQGKLALYDLRELGFGALTGVPVARLGADIIIVATDVPKQFIVLLSGEGLNLCGQLEATGAVRLSTDELENYQKLARTQWRKLSDVASIVASYLQAHPKIAEVRWPGLKTDSSFKIAAQTLEGGFGARIDWRVKNSSQWHSYFAQAQDWQVQVLEFECKLKTL
ncbi:PLP-dependent transferase [Atopobium fossor]|uniref:PLP-dependent transferase n=1 Tax=Atopobium fossor TaxID=39487 RepID=UPI00146F9CB7|nr:PLP-dependent transferase [Atopobium fossor]